MTATNDTPPTYELPPGCTCYLARFDVDRLPEICTDPACPHHGTTTATVAAEVSAATCNGAHPPHALHPPHSPAFPLIAAVAVIMAVCVSASAGWFG